MDADRLPGSAAVLVLYTGCVLTVLGFVNLFPLYQHINETLGGTFIALAPFLLPVLLLAVLWRGFSGKMSLAAANWPLLVAGLALCLLALSVPDPNFSVKRIHLFQYLLLSLLIRYTMSRRLRKSALLISSILFGSLLGVHDEFLQGLHPQRTYGLRDMLVNSLSVTGGSLLWHGLGLFTNHRQEVSSAPLSRAAVIFLVLHLVTVIALVIPLVFYRNNVMPLWPFVPVAGIVFFWCCHLSDDTSAWRHGLLVLNLVVAAFLVYPFATNAFEIPFH
ncbi:VanZ family protein [Desulfofustis limnaeus]|jgi:VanZ family protein|uniref:VanZ-like domain-containing protein n=1 Tax=Desulfofustis limnaeus TaxID=2740163 RepID=A0ABM7W444_9BACT|nr:VanZ family protein [Desulfofustis limnaeus]MDX9894705.1 VanZ family protein [Desulfofustis sp.]BDD85683.1 hypothetical protein DPPLL_00480 [Desulfofustis limnaeus]